MIDVDQVSAAYYDRQPDPSAEGQRVSFGTSGHRGRALDGTFNENHVLAVSEAVCRYRSSQGIDGPLVPGPRHPPPVRARVPHHPRGAGRARGGGDDRRRRRLHAHPGDLARDPHPQPRRRRPPRRRDRGHPLAQPTRGRRLQVQPAQRRARGHRRSRAGCSDEANAPAGRGTGRREARPVRAGAGGPDHPPPRLRVGLRGRAARGDRPRRDPRERHPARGRPPGRRVGGLLAGRSPSATGST